MYTDASKSKDSVGCSVTTSRSIITQHRLPKICSIHTAELYGIHMALKSINDSNKMLTICTDSLSSIQSINNMYTQNPLVQSIHESCHNLASQGISVTIVWTPSHVGISGNEMADKAAKQALHGNLVEEHVQTKGDLKNSFKQIIVNKWQNIWTQSNTKLHQIQPQINTHTLEPMNRRDKIIIRRLRIGHTLITHSYLMSSSNPPLCIPCNRLLTVQHFLTECPKYANARQRYKLADLKENLTSNLQNVIEFLHDVNLYYNI